MKKLLVALALLTLSTVGLAVEVTPVVDGNSGIFIVDGKKVYFCKGYKGCFLISDDYKKSKKYK